MDNSLKFFYTIVNKRSVKLYAFTITSYLLFIIIGIKSVNYISPSDPKFWENIIPVAGLFFSGILGFILDKEKEQGLKLYEKKIEACQDFFKVLEEVIEDNVIQLSRNTLGKKDELNRIFFAISKLRMHFEEKDILEIICRCTEIIEVLKNRKKNEKEYYQKFSFVLFEISKFFKEKLEQFKPNDKKENLKEPNQFVIALEEFILNSIETKDIKAVPVEKNWHVNVGEDYNISDSKNQYRCWSDMKEFSFWSAGGAKRYADGVKKLEERDTIYAYISGKGYVAKGIIEKKAVLVRDFFKGKNIEKIVSKSFKEHLKDITFEDFHSEDSGEYAVKVNWEFKDLPIKNPNLRVSPLTICNMNQANLNILKKEFKEKSG